jgi:hypothetical protein
MQKAAAFRPFKPSEGNPMKRWLLAMVTGFILSAATVAQDTPAPGFFTSPAMEGAAIIVEAPADAPAPQVVTERLVPLAAEPSRRSFGLWASGDYLLWTIKDAPMRVTLVAGAPPAAIIPPLVGTPGFAPALGGSAIDMSARSGGRFNIGYWTDDDQTFGTVVNYLFLGTGSQFRAVGSNGSPGSAALALPFFDVSKGAESSTAIASPGLFAGVAAIKVTDDLQGWEWNGLARLTDSDNLRLHLIGGFRYFNFMERAAFNTSSPSVVPPLDVFLTRDEFDCSNYFYGAQVGCQFEYEWRRIFIQSQAKVAIGAMHEVVINSGLLTTNDFDGFGARQNFPAGYLVGPSNAGKLTATHFGVIPEFNLNIGFRLRPRLDLLMGYTFLYVNTVVRPGDQIDRALNPSQFPAITGVPSTAVVGAPRPAPQVNTTDFWAQGINFGIQLTF